MVTYTARGVAGSDGYWYIADVETLLAGNPKTTNGLFPVFVGKGQHTSPGFLHDILNLYIVLPFAWLLGSYYGWITVNVISIVISGWLVYHLISRSGSLFLANIGAIVTILFPLNFIYASVVSAEPMILPFLLAATWFYIYGENRFGRYFGTMIFLGLAYFCRTVYVLILLAIPVLYYLQNRRKTKYAYQIAIILTAFGCLIIVLQPLIFDSSMLSVMENINAKSSFGDIMSAYFNLIPPQFDAIGLISHGIGSFKQQLTFPSDTLGRGIWGIIHGTIVLFLLTFFRAKSEPEKRLAILTIALLITHFMMIFLFQYQIRYLILILPFTMSYLLLKAVNIRIGSPLMKSLLLLILVILLISIDIIVASRNRSNLENFIPIQKKIAALIEKNIPHEDGILVEDENDYRYHYIDYGYFLRPRNVMFVRACLPDTLSYIKLRNVVQARWLICNKNSKLLDYYSPAELKVDSLPPPFDKQSIYYLAGVLP